MLFATVLALASALLHATWNLFVKTSDDRELAAWGQWIAGALLFCPVLVFAGLPDAAAWKYLVASALVHVVYVYALVTAYQRGDFSLAYPLARGGGALVAAVLGAIVLSDDLPAGAWIALVVVAGGLASLVSPRAPVTEISFALATAAVIGTYTVIDTDGARHTDNGFVYACALMLASAAAISTVALTRGRGHDLVASLPAQWPKYVGAGACLTGAYGLVLVAVKHAPVGYVATLRESSVVLGAAMGWLLLHEPLGGRRLVSSVVIACGLIALIVFG